MLIELVILAAVGLLGAGTMAASKDIGRFPRPMYGALVSWWYGGFADNTAATVSATMIDSDYNCDAWGPTDGYKHNSNRYLYNESLGLEVCVPNGNGLSSVRVKTPEKGWIDVPQTAYDDYLLAKAFDRWKKRKAQLDLEKKHRSAARLVDQRINENYIKTIEMIEKKILNDGRDTASELRAMLPSPDHPEVKQTWRKLGDRIQTGR